MKRPTRYAPVNPKLSALMHGGDYNPDQWLESSEIIDEDFRLMKLAGCNVVSLGIFAWTTLEPEEGRFAFEWLDAIMDRLAKNGAFAILATPSGARPAWMSAKYPEVLRVDASRVRILHGKRHNHCYTSPIYREQVRIIDEELARRYGNHPALLLWHLSNEFGGECHCELCQNAFRGWLKERYSGDLDSLNREWWTRFWSHTYTEWSQIESPAPHGESLLHGLVLDWKRFVTHQTGEFMRAEIAAVRRHSTDIPITTNFMGTYPGLDYWRLAEDLDVVSWDNYPAWHGRGQVRGRDDRWDPEGRDYKLASDVAFVHDLNRSLKGGKPFILMESTPSATNWQPVAKLKRPGMHLLSSIQAVAHGSESVLYFQWRKSRGSSEKFHGAVVDHTGHENTRVFREVSEVGGLLAKLGPVVGTSVSAEVALIYDWENRWAIEGSQGPRNDGLTDYERTCKAHYFPFWQLGIPVDVINMDQDFSPYRLLVAPMLYMVRAGVGERIAEFVRAGGTFVATYWSGIANENDLCFLGGFPGPLREVLGIWSEEIDALYPEERNRILVAPGAELPLPRPSYEAFLLCDLIHAEGARVLAEYAADFYAGRPALTVNDFGRGRGYYIASRNEDAFQHDFYEALVGSLEIARNLDVALPAGVTVGQRTDGRRRFLFVQNFTPEPKRITVGATPLVDLATGEKVREAIDLGGWGVRILER